MFSEQTFNRRYRIWLVIQALTGPLVLASVWGRPDSSNAFVVICGWAVGSLASLVAAGGGLRGLADVVTTARVGLLLTWVGVAGPGVGWSLILAAILAMDLADGWVARRGTPTRAGAIYDMESDQIVVLVLAYHVHGMGVPGWVLALPGLKYVSVLVSTALSVPIGDPKPLDGDNRRARVIYAFVLIALWAAAALGPSPFVETWIGVAVLILAFSFAGDFRFSFRRHGKRTSEAV